MPTPALSTVTSGMALPASTTPTEGVSMPSFAAVLATTTFDLSVPVPVAPPVADATGATVQTAAASTTEPAEMLSAILALSIALDEPVETNGTAPLVDRAEGAPPSPVALSISVTPPLPVSPPIQPGAILSDRPPEETRAAGPARGAVAPRLALESEGERPKPRLAPARDPLSEREAVMTVGRPSLHESALTLPSGQIAFPVAHAGPASAPAQQLFEHALQSVADTQWLDRVTDGIAAVAKGTGDLRVRMDTEALGQLTVAMALAEATTKVRIGVADERVRDAIDERTAHASATAAALGAPLSSIAVDVDRQRQHARGTAARAKIEAKAATAEPARPTDRHRYA